MGIRALPSGSFQARITIDGLEHAATFRTRADAEDWIEMLRARALMGQVPNTALTVAEWALRWMRTYETAPSGTRNWHQDNIDRHIVPKIGQLRASAVTPSTISTLLNKVTAEVSAAAADRVYRTCSAMFSAAVQDDIIPRNPVRSKRHRPRRQKPEHVILERSQARQMLLQLGGWQRDTAVLQIALGARFGEIAGLTPHDVNLRARTVTIRRRVAKGTVRATKNHRLRTLDLPQTVIPTVERLVREAFDPEPIPDLADREWPSLPWNKRWLIQTAVGYPPNLSAFNKALKEACAGCGAPRISSHGLRHSYVSWMIDDGHSADKIAFWIGDTPATVRSVYAHMLEASSAPAAASIYAALGDL